MKIHISIYVREMNDIKNDDNNLFFCNLKKNWKEMIKHE